MSGAADRRLRGRRNRLVDLLGLGWPAPLVDLPVLVAPGSLDPDEPVPPPATAPVVVPFGGLATLAIADAEPEVTYRIRADSGGTSLSNRRAEGRGRGGRLDLPVPRVDRAVTFSVEATTPHGRRAILAATQAVKVGLDRLLPLAVDDDGAAPLVVDHGGRVSVTMARSQEAVAYALVARAPDDGGPEDQLQDMEGDVAPPGRLGDGGAMTFVSEPLADDCVLRVRADRVYGKGQRQATLMEGRIPVHVRADRDRPVTIAPAVSEHLGTPRVRIGDAQAGVRYDLVVGAVPDAGFSRTDPPAAGTVAAGAATTPLNVAVPALGPVWQPIAGHAETDAAGEGRGRTLTIATPPLAGDATIVVRATKRHRSGDTAFETAVPLATPVVALVRPDPEPALHLVAAIVGEELVGLALRGGQPGVFYALSAAGEPLGELYVHQRDPVEAERNKGLGRLGIGIDLAVAADLATAAPPPVPRLDCARALPLIVSIEARRATTGLRRALAAEVSIAAPPPIRVRAKEGGLVVTVPRASPDATHLLLVDGDPCGESVAGDGRSLALATGPLAAEAVVELLIAEGAVSRRIAVPAR